MCAILDKTVIKRDTIYMILQTIIAFTSCNHHDIFKVQYIHPLMMENWTVITQTLIWKGQKLKCVFRNCGNFLAFAHTVEHHVSVCVRSIESAAASSRSLMSLIIGPIRVQTVSCGVKGQFSNF